jgi:serine/threonine protein kinase
LPISEPPPRGLSSSSRARDPSRGAQQPPAREQADPTGETQAAQALPEIPQNREIVEGLGHGDILADRYRILRPLGKGGMGAVFLAEHDTIKKKVAIKVLLEERAKQANQKERFLNEARATAKIRHPNVIDISDFGETPDGRAFFVMEYLDGEDLKVCIKRRHVLPWNEGKTILLQVCAALSAAHKAGVVHRDLKPDNIFLIARQGMPNFVKVLDFGLAKILNEPNAKKLTKTGIIVGTPAFLSPEQVKGDPIDHRADIYALGLIMYRMLCGRLPFKAKSVVEMLRKHLLEAPLPPSEMRPDANIPIRANEVVLRALAKKPEGRFDSMEEMGRAIAAVDSGVRARSQVAATGPYSPVLHGPLASGEPMSEPAGTPPQAAAEVIVEPIAPGSTSPSNVTTEPLIKKTPSSDATGPGMVFEPETQSASQRLATVSADHAAPFADTTGPMFQGLSADSSDPSHEKFMRSQLLTNPEQASHELRTDERQSVWSPPLIGAIVVLVLTVIAIIIFGT